MRLIKLSQLSGDLNFSRSGVNLVCKPGKSKASKINCIQRNFLNEMVMLFCNKLPTKAKNTLNLNVSKSNLQIFKIKTKALEIHVR